ncbi:short-chain dehydrogenase/reductase SDR [Catenovulum agarivorans DS-2]|uniref:Short-chain dehydrogenase/reductase SDR n=1 Tax=Catenovulum agarivorans DS-2 TaxID=1328313 RepID=W7QVT7_9ALTE|nr:SDR family NAD(P)-dependent oxidoreductase [Catenovulum agarivorans]EWH09400.1 short-chain dehydrogenase/reductase SDR [Catenovulum agarivorans DS-2]
MKSILITGASSGIGKAVAELYARNGFQVFAGGRNKRRLDQLCAQHANIKPFVCDLSNRSELAAAAASLPKLDIVVLNAGTCEYIDNPMQFDGDMFARVIQTNVVSVGYCLQHLLPLIKKGGQLALVSSSAQFLPFPRATAYGSSKAAISYLARTLAIELKPHDIAVSLVHPGFVETPLTDKNNFDMPGIISAQQAAQAIFKGITKRKAEINFPFSFICFLKLFTLLPRCVWNKVAQRMTV